MSDRLRPALGTQAHVGATTPRFSLRFQHGRASLSLSQPLLLPGGRLDALELDVGAITSSTDLTRGWRGLRHRRGVARALRLTLDVEHLLSRVAGLELVGPTRRGLLVTLARAHAHVAFELRPALRGADLVFFVEGARCALDGPRPPTAEALSIAAELGTGFDPELGAIVVGDALTDALTDALVPHGMRVPTLSEHRRAQPEIRGGDLVLGLATEDAKGRDGLEVELELARVMSAIAEGRFDEARELSRGLRAASSSALSDELGLEAGDVELPLGLDAPSAALALRRALRRGDVEDVARAARALDGHERAFAVAVDGLLAAAAFARSLDPSIEGELLMRALARAPDDPRVLARALPSPAPDAARALLRTLERSAALRRRDVGVEWAAIGRLRLSVGDARGSIDAFERAVIAAPSDGALHEGLAEALGADGQHDAAVRAWKTTADARERASDPVGRARAQLGAACLLEGSGRVREALLSAQAARAGAKGALEAEVETAIARLALAAGDTGALATAERALVALADRAEPSLRQAVAAAIASALSGRPTRPLLEALARLWPEHPALGERREALDKSAFEEIEASPAEERAGVARRLSERLRGEGRIGQAALALVRAGELLRDAATLRAAVDLAERAGDPETLEHVVERALSVVGDGPARAALERRRPTPAG